MTIVRALMIAAVLASLAPMSPARAGAPTNEFLAHVVGRLYRGGETFACFSRQYEDAYLAAHPKQNAIFAKLLVSAHFRESSLDPKHDFYSYQLSMAFKFRGRSETLTTVAECGDGKPRDSLRNGAVCAGPKAAGQSHLALQGDRSLLMTIPDGADLWAPGPMDQRHGIVKNPFGPDDKLIRLDRTDLSQCEDLAFDRQKPLRAHEP
jgi:hypothetical protein